MSTSAKKRIEEVVAIPEGCTVAIEGTIMKVKGKEGEIQKRVAHPIMTITHKGKEIILIAEGTSRNGKRMVQTVKAHVKNMLRGVNEKFVYKLKVCAGHFPVTVKVEKDGVAITNFLGEKIPRKAKILPGVEVKVDKDMITVSSADIEAAGQTAANIETMTRITNRDRRVFQDGCYIVETPRTKFI